MMKTNPIGITAFVTSLCFAALAAADMPEGVVAHWTFDEGVGNVARDVSGNGLDGIIRGAQYVPYGDGFALEFDGNGAHVDCGSPPELDLRDTFSVELWLQVTEKVGGDRLQAIAGKSIRYFGFLFSPMSSQAWWFAPNPHAKGSVPVHRGRWHHLVGTYDKGEGRIYLDGHEAWFSRPQGKQGQIASNAEAPFVIGAASTHENNAEVAGGSFKGLIAEAAVYDRALSPEDVVERYNSLRRTDVIELAAGYIPPYRTIAVDIQTRALGELPDDARARVRIIGDGKILAEQSDPVITASFRSFEFDAAQLAAGEYTVTAEVIDNDGNWIGYAASREVDVPVEESRFPRETPYGVRLNNLVVEMVNVPIVAEDENTFSFRREREGWTFVSADIELLKGERVEWIVRDADGNAATWLTVDSASKPESWQGSGTTWEVMRRLPAGRYDLEIRRTGRALIDNLIVRAVPVLGWFDLHDLTRHPQEGERNPHFYAERALRNCNIGVYGRSPIPQAYRPFFHQWRAAGREALQNVWLPHPRGTRWTEEQMTVGAITARTLEQFTADTELDGIIMDELHGRTQYSPLYEEFAHRFHEQTGKSVSVFTGTVYRYPEHLPFLQAAVDSGGIIAFEAYLSNRPSLLEEWGTQQSLVAHMARFRRAMPEIAPHVVVNIGTFSVPRGTFVHWVEGDMKAHIELMMYRVANAPEFEDTGGVMNYKAGLNDEQMVDWFSALLRHYFIEGNRDMLAETPYIVRHLRNPAFVEGLHDWRVNPSQPDSVRADTYVGFGAMQGQGWPLRVNAPGDSMVVMRRSASAPNRMAQTLKNLVPGQWYAVSVVTADRHDRSADEVFPFRIDVSVDPENIHRRYGHSFQNLNFASPDDARGQASMNFHRLVFQATDTEAELVLSDWDQAHTPPDSHIGQEMMISQVEVTPYFAPSQAVLMDSM